MTKRSSFLSLSIKGACLGAWGTAFIARGARIEGSGLERLCLSNCRLRAEGAASVASLLSRGTRLLEVDLGGNNIGDDGMNSLATELLKNEFLEKLILPHNRIGNKRMKALATALAKHENLRVLDLSHNLLSFAGACNLAEGVRDSQSLQRLYLGYNLIRVDGLYRLSQVCIGHVSMAHVDVRGVPLRRSDRNTLEARTRYTRLVFVYDAEKRPAEASKPEATGSAPADAPVAEEAAPDVSDRPDLRDAAKSEASRRAQPHRWPADSACEELADDKEGEDISDERWVFGFAKLGLY